MSIGVGGGCGAGDRVEQGQAAVAVHPHARDRAAAELATNAVPSAVTITQQAALPPASIEPVSGDSVPLPPVA